MSAALVVLFLLAVFLAYANGSNDVSKGIATLAGSGVTTYPCAIHWGTLCTVAGAIAGAFLGKAMVRTFAQGLLTAGASPTLAVAVATIVGAAAWVAVATRTGLPVSTTHAIVGSITAVGVAAYGWNGVNWPALVGKIAVPLLLSPIVSMTLTATLLLVWNGASRTADGFSDCLCLEGDDAMEFPGPASSGAAVATSGIGAIRILTGTQQVCAATQPSAFRLTINQLHWLTSGATSFARGLNDAPKMAALILAASALTGKPSAIATPAFLFVALGILVGSWIGGQKVTAVLAEKVTRMDHREGFAANLVTALLVGPGAALGLPMSTTHVSSGAIIGAGILKDGGINRRTVLEMLLAWIVTLPAAAAVGTLVYELLMIGRIA